MTKKLPIRVVIPVKEEVKIELPPEVQTKNRLFKELEELQAGRNLSDIPISDKAYWDKRDELQAFENSLT